MEAYLSYILGRRVLKAIFFASEPFGHYILSMYYRNLKKVDISAWLIKQIFLVHKNHNLTLRLQHKSLSLHIFPRGCQHNFYYSGILIRRKARQQSPRFCRLAYWTPLVIYMQVHLFLFETGRPYSNWDIMWNVLKERAFIYAYTKAVANLPGGLQQALQNYFLLLV